MRVLLAGDTGFGESYRVRERSKGRVDPIAVSGYGHALAGVDPLLAAADLTIVNLETPLIEADHPDAVAADKRYVHWSDGRRTAAVLARRGVTAVSLGNNHAADQGLGGLRHTLATLSRFGIETIGAGLHEAEATRPFRRQLEIGVTRVSLSVLGGKQRWRANDPEPFARDAAGGLNGWKRRRAGAQVAAERALNPDAFIVAFPHWGSNYRRRARRQERLAHTLIDAGADLVVGHGAHMLQGIEQYRGRWIVYGLGNFVFASPGRFQKVEEAIPYGGVAMLELTTEEGGGVGAQLRLFPILVDNRVTGYRPRPVDDAEMNTLLADLRDRSPRDTHPALAATAGDLGPHVVLPIGTMPAGGIVRSARTLVPVRDTAASASLRTAS
ncbi:MAG: CapA family protein [Phycisphaerae bacterium]|nr:CapA family protein [Phycisphaerae bacterium]